jgi:plastocyanin
MKRWLLGLVAGAVALPAVGSARYQGGEVPDAGGIFGVVRLSGSAPKPEEFRITKDQNVCGEKKAMDDLTLGWRSGIRNVVVSIEGITQGKKPEMELPLTLDQKGCRYEPRVQATMVGNTLRLLNSDPILHNIHAYKASATAFNVAMPFSGMKTEKKLENPGVFDVRCDAGHTWMRAWIHVFEHPYFAVTAEDGSFKLSDVPPGKYKLRFWHERLGTVEKEVEVAAKGEAKVQVDFKAD